MDKERLEEIKKVIQSQRESVRKLGAHDMKWLISTVEEQANKIESFQNLKEILEEANQGMSAKVEEQEEEIELTKADLNVKKVAWEAQGFMIRKLHEETARLEEKIKIAQADISFYRGYAVRFKEELHRKNEVLKHYAKDDIRGEKARQVLAGEVTCRSKN